MKAHVDDSGTLVWLDDDAETLRLREEEQARMRIDFAPTLDVEITRPKAEASTPAEYLPVPEIDYSLSFTEELMLKGAIGLKAVRIAWKYLPLALQLVYGVIVMDWKAIIRSIAMIIVTILVGSVGLPADFSIAGVSLETIVTTLLIFIAGWVLPQLRSLLPDWIKALVGWKDPAPGK
jgi:hypothetical protein